jgi:hypothetical protein
VFAPVRAVRRRMAAEGFAWMRVARFEDSARSARSREDFASAAVSRRVSRRKTLFSWTVVASLRMASLECWWKVWTSLVSECPPLCGLCARLEGGRAENPPRAPKHETGTVAVGEHEAEGVRCGAEGR